MPSESGAMPLWFVFELWEQGNGAFPTRVVEATIACKTAELRHRRLAADQTASVREVQEAAEFLADLQSDLKWYGCGPALMADPVFVESLSQFFEAFQPSYQEFTHEEIQDLLMKSATDHDVPSKLVNLHLAWGALQEVASTVSRKT